MRLALFSLAAMLVVSSPVRAQETERDQVMVWYTSHTCPDIEAGTPGSTRERAITLEDFGDLYDAAVADPEEARETLPAQSQYECRWVRISGFLEWMNYYHYRATLAPDAWTSYGRGGGARYIVERFSDAAVRRVDVVRRRVTLTGRFYDLCAAAERDRAQDEDEWVMLLGPCHYAECSRKRSVPVWKRCR
jgi:hypothetical protein